MLVKKLKRTPRSAKNKTVFVKNMTLAEGMTERVMAGRVMAGVFLTMRPVDTINRGKYPINISPNTVLTIKSSFELPVVLA